ncbi:fasciclin-1-like isoform X1 [Artemia franciscana]|uniref:fasciclin-1-like isoform X1 n=1 Tax=Artemia franciscana TaxID=6661 RepID=UPI0032DA8762
MKDTLYIWIFGSLLSVVWGENLYELLQSRSDLSQFADLVTKDELVLTLLKFRQGTLFAPTNDAIQMHRGPKDSNFLLYHLSNVALTLDKLEQSVTSELPGNPPLWVTRRKIPESEDFEHFINNAKVIEADVKGTTQSQEQQVLHIIDEALESTVPVNKDSSLSNPDALRLLEKANAFGLSGMQVTDFFQRIIATDRTKIFSTPGGSTFFIPVNKGFETVSREKVDSKVVDGHVVPGAVIFTRASIPGRPIKTLTFGDNIKVTLAMNNDSIPGSPGGYQPSVQSNTRSGDYNHPKGVVISSIVKANIPVKNGVVHLIEKPLVVIDKDMVNFLKEERNGRLQEFYKVVKDYAPDFMEEITRAGELTLFAPSNDAFINADQDILSRLLANSEKLREVLQLHLVRRRVSSDDIELRTVVEVDTADRHRKLYFNAIGQLSNRTLTVEGGGVNATIVQGDIAALNGLVHIVDKILGIPSASMLDKILSDPMMSDSATLGSQSGFNLRLGDTNRKYTYFVPSNDAWLKIQRNHASTHKKLFMGGFGYQSEQALEHHLLIGRGMKIADLEELFQNSKSDRTQIQMLRGRLNLRVEKTQGDEPGDIKQDYYIERDGIRARVIRPDVQCTNGVIHVIDEVLIHPRDVSVSSSSTRELSVLASIFSSVLAFRSL